MSELAYLSAIEIAEKIRQREISSREAVDYFLARVEKLDKTINAVVTIDAERARKEADAADAALARGEKLGPLHGVPMTVKENIDLTGWHMCSVTGNQQHPLDSGIGAGAYRTFINNGPPIWNDNSPDPGALYNPEGQLVSYFNS